MTSRPPGRLQRLALLESLLVQEHVMVVDLLILKSLAKLNHCCDVLSLKFDLAIGAGGVCPSYDVHVSS